MRTASTKLMVHQFIENNPLEGAVRFIALAIPQPTQKDFNTQLGVHLEEFAETLEELTAETPDVALVLRTAIESLRALSKHSKEVGELDVLPGNEIAFLDALCDNIQTAASVAHTKKMDLVGAFTEVVYSNHSKFVDGKPVFDANRKVQKGPHYFKPVLGKFLNQ